MPINMLLTLLALLYIPHAVLPHNWQIIPNSIGRLANNTGLLEDLADWEIGHYYHCETLEIGHNCQTANTTNKAAFSMA